MHTAGGGPIYSCDVVALEYKTGWWFSCSDHDEGSPCKTRTCKPLQDPYGGNWDNWDRRCTWEMFSIRAKGQHCWSPIRDGSVVVLSTNGSWGKVGKRQTFKQGWNPIPGRVDNTVRTGKTEPSSPICMARGRRGCVKWSNNYSMEFLLRVKKD
jgi:hypothetical protein